jgi:hypothetical protein
MRDVDGRYRRLACLSDVRKRVEQLVPGFRSTVRCVRRSFGAAALVRSGTSSMNGHSDGRRLEVGMSCCALRKRFESFSVAACEGLHKVGRERGIGHALVVRKAAAW